MLGRKLRLAVAQPTQSNGESSSSKSERVDSSAGFGREGITEPSAVGQLGTSVGETAAQRC